MIRLYLDGRLQTQTGELEGGADGTGSMRLGNDASGAFALHGSIRDPAFYRAAFSETALNDSDADGVPRAVDNCTEEKNRLQIDSDLDGFGNVCDADYDGSGRVMLHDVILLRRAIHSKVGDPAYSPELDRDSDGLINLVEFNYLRGRYGSVPGPSGLACAGSVPCEAP